MWYLFVCVCVCLNIILSFIDVESQYPVLSQLETVHIEHSQEANKVSDKMNKLTDDYNTLVRGKKEDKLSYGKEPQMK